MFSCEFREIFKNTYFEEHMRTTISEQKNIWIYLRITKEYGIQGSVRIVRLSR